MLFYCDEQEEAEYLLDAAVLLHLVWAPASVSEQVVGEAVGLTTINVRVQLSRLRDRKLVACGRLGWPANLLGERKWAATPAGHNLADTHQKVAVLADIMQRMDQEAERA